MSDQERLELMLEYAMGTLDVPRAEIARQGLLSGDPAWAAALAEAEATLAAYAGSQPPVAPPPQGKSKLMTIVAREQSFGRPIATHAMPDEFRIIRRFSQAFAVLAAILLLGVVVNVWVMRRVSAARQQAQDDVHQQLIDTKATIMALQLRIEHDSKVLGVLHSNDLKIVDLGVDPSEVNHSHAVGRILVDQQRAVWYLFAASMTPLPADKTYQLWYITPEKKMISAGTFNVDLVGNATWTVAVPNGIGPIAMAAITEEPKGGSAQPTKLPPVLAGKL